MGDTTDIKKGAVVRHNGNLFVISSFQFVNPGKGQAFTKTKPWFKKKKYFLKLRIGLYCLFDIFDHSEGISEL